MHDVCGDHKIETDSLFLVSSAVSGRWRSCFWVLLYLLCHAERNKPVPAYSGNYSNYFSNFGKCYDRDHGCTGGSDRVLYDPFRRKERQGDPHKAAFPVGNGSTCTVTACRLFWSLFPAFHKGWWIWNILFCTVWHGSLCGNTLCVPSVFEPEMGHRDLGVFRRI